MTQIVNKDPVAVEEQGISSTATFKVLILGTARLIFVVVVVASELFVVPWRGGTVGHAVDCQQFPMLVKHLLSSSTRIDLFERGQVVKTVGEEGSF